MGEAPAQILHHPELEVYDSEERPKSARDDISQKRVPEEGSSLTGTLATHSIDGTDRSVGSSFEHP